MNGGAAPLIKIERVCKRYGDFLAVDRVDLDIVAGEFFALLGASGCGKTTLLRLLGGFETPSEGRILIDGVDMSQVPPYERPVNMMFQSYALFPHMTVEQNIAFGLRQDHLPKAVISARIDSMLELVQMTSYKKRKPSQLSGGQRQRVALARCLAKQPKVLLLDEPLGALDLKLRHQMQAELKKLQVQSGITFIYVTHDQEEALTMSDRVAVFRAGRIEQIGTPSEIYERPLSAFVADFVGTSSLLRRDGKTIMLRPEKIRILPPNAEAASDESAQAGVVSETQYLGMATRVTITLQDGVKILSTWHAGDDEFVPREGVEIMAAWRRADEYILPKEA